MIDLNKEYNSSKEIIERYNEISFSKNTDLVFEKIDSMQEIKQVSESSGFMVIKYVTKSGLVIKHEKWDDVVTIMDKDNNKAKDVYLVREFLKIRGYWILSKLSYPDFWPEEIEFNK